MKFQGKTVRVKEKGHGCAGEFIRAHRLTGDSLLGQLLHCGGNILHPEGQVPESACFGSSGTLGRIKEVSGRRDRDQSPALLICRFKKEIK